MKHGWNIRIGADQQVDETLPDMLRVLASDLESGLQESLSDGIERHTNGGFGEVWIVRTREDVEQAANEHRCDNCKQHFAEEDLINPIPDLQERLEPGSIVPSGECPLCGALCYPVNEPGHYQGAKETADTINALTQQPTTGLFETFKNLLIGCGESWLDDDGVDEQVCESMARQLVAEVERVNAKPAEPIIVTVSGGLVQDVTNVPSGITVEVRDYDNAAGYDPEECRETVPYESANGTVATTCCGKRVDGVCEDCGAAGSPESDGMGQDSDGAWYQICEYGS
jgi:hypothetical protein